MEWQPIGPPAHYRVGAVTLGGGDVMSGGRAAADDRLAACPVGRAYDAFVIGEQVDRCLTHDPPPRLAVVQRRRSARQADCFGDDLGVRGRASHENAPPFDFRSSRRSGRLSLDPWTDCWRSGVSK